MKFLELFERIHNILILGKFLSRLTEFLFSLKILLEVKVSQISVYLDFIIELLDIELVCIIQIPEVLCRNRSDGAPSCLKVPECGECGPEIILLLDKRLKFINDSLFLGKVVFPFSLYLLIVFGTLFLIFHVYSLESVFKCSERIQCLFFILRFRLRLDILFCCIFRSVFFRNFQTGRCLFLREFLVKSSLDRLCFLRFRHTVITSCQFLEKLGKFCQSHVRIVCNLFIFDFLLRRNILDLVFRSLGHGIFKYIWCRFCTRFQFFTHN